MNLSDTSDDHVWVAVNGNDRPGAYLIAGPVDGNIHVEQVSVHPDSAHHGVGRSMLEHVAGRMRCGFRFLDETELTPGLREIRRRETCEARVSTGIHTAS